MTDVREKIQNNLANAHRALASVTQFQKEEIKKLQSIENQYHKIMDEEMEKLEAMEHGSDEREEHQKRIKDLSNKLMATQETIVQYQMNLRELKAV